MKSVKRTRLAGTPGMNQKITVSDLCTSHLILAPNEYSSATIGIHSSLVRCLESEHLARGFYQALIIDLDPKDFIHRLDAIVRKLSDKCQLDSERCPMVARLRFYLNKHGEVFKEILKNIKKHLHECMCEVPLPSVPQSNDALMQQCFERNRAAVGREIASRMQRLQFYDYDEVGRPMNLINLQDRTREDCHLLINQIKSDIVNRSLWEDELRKLLNNSFFIVQHPSPAVVTLSTPKHGIVTAKLNCQIFSLLDVFNSEMIPIEDIVPIVCCLPKSDQVEGTETVYQQSPLPWKTYSIVTMSNTRREFHCAETLEICLNETKTVGEGRTAQEIKLRHAPFVYHLAFHITITVPNLGGQEPFQHIVVVRSAPFGLVTNTSQTELLLATVFLEDLKSWKTMLQSTPMAISDMDVPGGTPANLTIVDVVDGIRRYFIHKTGIHPKPWVMPYITEELKTQYTRVQDLTNESFQLILAKFLAQIDYMAEHALLTFFHDDGLFLGICDSEKIHRILLYKKQATTENVCAMRFGSIHRMACTKDVGVRIDLAHTSYVTIQNYTFSADKISFDLASFIIKIALCEASYFESVICAMTENNPLQIDVTSIGLKTFVDLYDDNKLRELCPYDNRYLSIWISFYHKENKKPENSSSCTTYTQPQNPTVANAVADTNTNNNPSHHSRNPQPCTTYQTPMASHMQVPYTANPNIPQSALPYPCTPQNHGHLIHPSPIVIIISPNTSWKMSDQNVAQLISNYLPQYSQLPIRSDHIHRFCISSPPSQPFDAGTQASQNFPSNS